MEQEIAKSLAITKILICLKGKLFARIT
jgi:hypothetical protein